LFLLCSFPSGENEGYRESWWCWCVWVRCWRRGWGRDSSQFCMLQVSVKECVDAKLCKCEAVHWRTIW
jgi:hypothetical protein